MKPGIHHGVPLAEYLSWPYPSKSGLMAFAQSPAQYQHERLHPKEATDRMLKGGAVDCLVFDGPKGFDARYMRLPPGMRRDKRHKKYQEFLAEAGDREVLKGEDFDQVAEVARAVVDYPLAGQRIHDGTAQLSIVWDDPDTGLRLKGRPDLLTFTNEIPEVVDLKVTADPRPEPFQRVIHNMRYHWQAAIYLDGLSVLHGYGIDQFSFIVVQDAPPYSVEVYRLHQTAIEQGRLEYKALLAQFQACEAEQTWPASTGEIQTIDLPHWGYPWKGADDE